MFADFQLYRRKPLVSRDISRFETMFAKLSSDCEKRERERERELRGKSTYAR